MGRSLEEEALADLGVRPTMEDQDWRKQELKSRLFGEPGTPSKLGRYTVLGPPWAAAAWARCSERTTRISIVS